MSDQAKVETPVRTLRPSTDLTLKGSIGYFSVEEPSVNNPAGSWTTCIFTKPGDREDFIALVEYKERLAPKGYIICRRLDDGKWELADQMGDPERVENCFYGVTLLEAVRRARAHVEGDPELLPV